MLEHKNPSITSYARDMEPSRENNFDLDNEHFMLAFGMRSFRDGIRDDERYVKWVAE